MAVVDGAEMDVAVLAVDTVIEGGTGVALGKIMPAAVAEDIVHRGDRCQCGVALNNVDGVLEVHIGRHGVGGQGIEALTEMQRLSQHVGIAFLPKATGPGNKESGNQQ